MSGARLRAAVTMALAFMLVAVPVAASNPYEDDPLGLVAYAGEIERVYTSGTDVVEVWICRFTPESAAVDLTATVNLLNSQVSPYFAWLSGGRYQPTFVPGGEVVSTLPEPDESNWLLFDCHNQVSGGSVGTANAALIVTNTDYTGGYGTIGITCQGPLTGCSKQFPDNGRSAVVGGGTITQVLPLSAARLIVVAHEIGHALAWGHSYSGLNVEGGIPFEYDNVMDLMSGGTLVTLTTGTHAFNRYAAGWIPVDRALFHRKGTATYRLGGLGSGAAEMLVLPSDAGPGTFDVLGVRTRTGYDVSLPVEGVEIYTVDQRPTACPFGAIGALCVGADRRVAQNPGGTGFESTAHVLGVGQSVTIRGVGITVDSAINGVYTVTVVGAAVAQRFVDDNGSLHESNIEKIANAGITLGCNPPLNDWFCPANSVTRAEMAAFLIRALDETDNLPPYSGRFPDVAAGAWYTPYVERLAEVGITAGRADGTYGPDDQVSRAEMSAFLLRALGLDQGLPAAAGTFADVSTTAWYASFAEKLLALGITTGCSASPLRYCPDDPVKREQMGSFLARAFALP